MPSVEIRGNTDLRKALRRFAPDLDKELRLELTRALKPVVKQARGFVPATGDIMRGWQPRSFSEARFPFYNSQVVTRGIGFSTSVSKPNKNGFTSNAEIFNKSAVGAIYETAGRLGHPQPWVGPKAGGTSKKVSRSNWKGAGQQFIDNLDKNPIVSSLAGRGRLIFRAWAANRGLAVGIAMTAIDKATTTFYARANSGTLDQAA
jgi:hypothetical protein